MEIVIQRVKEAKVNINGNIYAQINKGMFVLVGFRNHDTEKQCDDIVMKLANLRIFEDENGKMNVNILKAGYEMLVVPNFTLASDINHGNRPSFDSCMDTNDAGILFDYFCKKIEEKNIFIKSGKFKSEMDCYIVNDGPSTFILENKKRELK